MNTANFDLLSDVFATLRLQSELYFETDLRGDFSVQVPQDHRHIRFHLVRQGRSWVTVAGSEPACLGEGDLAVVPNGAEQILSDSPDRAPVPLGRLLEAGACRDGVLVHGDGDSPTRLLCGFCRFDEAVDHPVIAGLPPLLLVRPSELGAEPWVLTTLRLLALESDLKGQGTAGVLSRLLEIVFLQTVRRLSAGAAANGFIAALSDRQLARALQAMHRAPEARWTVRALAEEAGMSRGRFAAKFAQMVGTPPMQYLISWRLMKARALLAGTDLDMVEIAERCGYRSVPSFTRRFKAAFGIGPGGYRRSAGAP